MGGPRPPEPSKHSGVPYVHYNEPYCFTGNAGGTHLRRLSQPRYAFLIRATAMPKPKQKPAERKPAQTGNSAGGGDDREHDQDSDPPRTAVPPDAPAEPDWGRDDGC